MLKKVLEYVNDLCYDISRKFKIKEGDIMQGALMESVYDRTAKDYNENVNSNKLIDKVIDYLQHKLYCRKRKQLIKLLGSRYLEKNKNVCNGKIVIKGTRVQPCNVFSLLEEEDYSNLDKFIEKATKNYPTLNEEQIVFSLLYCLK